MHRLRSSFLKLSIQKNQSQHSYYNQNIITGTGNPFYTEQNYTPSRRINWSNEFLDGIFEEKHLIEFPLSVKTERELRVCSCTQILIADDEIFNIHCVGRMLKPHKLRYDTALDGVQVVERVKAKL